MRGFVLALLLVSGALPGARADAMMPAAWSRVLEVHVDDQGRIDFAALSRERQDLDETVQWIGAHGPLSDPADYTSPEAVLSYHLNAYNALAMHGVIERGIPDDFASFFKRARFFRFRKVQVDGDSTNLYDYENDVIRKLGDARIHFALNCMVRSCPRLPRQAFTAASLDADLERLTREFFASEKHFRLDRANKVLWVSEILKFYTEDFVAGGRVGDLPRYINRHRDEPVPGDYRVSFIDYDWTINRKP